MRRIASAGAGLAMVAWTAACVVPHSMGLSGPPGAACADDALAPPRDAPPDTTVLRWYRQGDEPNWSRGLEACGVVGPPVFQGDPTGVFGAMQLGDSLRVATWGVDAGGGDLRRMIGEAMGVQCNERGSTLRGGFPPFVLLVQHAYRAAPDLQDVALGPGVPPAMDPGARPMLHEDIVDIADACGLALHYVPSVRNGPSDGPRPGEDRGNAILATVPLTIPVAIELPIEAQRAVAVGASLVLPGGERARVVSAHVWGRTSLTRLLVGGNQGRARQALGLVDALDRADDDGPLNAVTVLGVDLALWDDGETAYRVVRDAFPESPSWDGLNTRGRFSADHLFFRRGSFQTVSVRGYERLPERYGSSHHPRAMVIDYVPLAGGG